MDNQVMNISTFGEIIKKPEDKQEMTFADVLSQLAPITQADADKEKDMPKSEKHNYAEFIRCSFEYALCIKMMHWQTFSLGEHKATDKLFTGMLPILDLVVETAMGKYGRPIADNWQIPVCNYESSEDLHKFLSEMAHCYSTKCKSLFSKEEDSEILNTLDTLIELINKTRYLVTLK